MNAHAPISSHSKPLSIVVNTTDLHINKYFSSSIKDQNSILIMPPDFVVIYEPQPVISQQCGFLASVDTEEPVQPSFKLKNSKLFLVSSLTVIE